jgi:hypothetical protein
MEVMTTIMITAFTLLLGIIGYYIVRENNRQDERHRQQTETNGKLFDMISKVNESLGELNRTMGIIRQEFTDHQAVCEYKFVKK